MTIDLPLSRAWTKGSFRDFLRKREVPEWLVDIALNDLADRKTMDVTVLKRMEDEFKEFMEGDLSCATVARMITDQGYETVNNMNAFIETIVNGRPTRITLSACGIPEPVGRQRIIALGPWNTGVRNGIDYYPFFTAGVLSAVDPMFNGRPETIPGH